MPGWLKWLLLIAGVFALVIVGYAVYQTTVYNPSVVEDLTDNPDSEYAKRAMLLTFADGRTIPVNYLREGDTVFVGADGPWWRIFRDGGVPVAMLIRGEKLTGDAVVVLDDPAYTKEVFARLRPRAPAWLPAWLNGKLVVITLH